MPKRCLKAVYRRPLQELHEENHGESPVVLKESIDVLRQKGLHVKGLFSGCAESRKVQLLVRAWDLGHNPLKLAKVQDCFAVAESLLQWLRLLPGPVIPCRLFRAFLQTQHASCQAQSLSELHLLFQQMHDCEFQTLVQLLGLLHDYCLAQRTEGYITPTLGQVFGPLILRGSEGPLPLPFPEDIAAAAELVDFMIADYSTVFSLQSPCSSPYHKPPSRARNGPILKRDLNERPRKSKGLGAAKNGAGSLSNENWPIKHLRVNVVAPIEDADVCCINPEFSGFPLGSPLSEDLVVPESSFALEDCTRNESSRLATVPEGMPLASESCHQEPELDDLVGKLLCGSMESMLFEDNDELFVARTSSLMSMSSVDTPRNYRSSAESTDVSSDEEMSHESPYSTPDKAFKPAGSPHYPLKDKPHFQRLGSLQCS